MPPTRIEWADQGLNFLSWNCHKVSPGCKHCYAAERSKKYPRNSVGGEFTNAPEFRPNSLEELRKTPPGQVVFVNTHSDTFHESIPLPLLQVMFAHMNARSDLIFLLLTKRPMIAYQRAEQVRWTPNIWLGTSVETNTYMHRIDALLNVPAQHYFLSLEPLLEQLNPSQLARYVRRVEWIIAGGESGEYRRRFDKSWAASIRDICLDNRVPFFFKQGSGMFAGTGRELDGRTWDEQPYEFSVHRTAYTPPEQGVLF